MLAQHPGILTAVKEPWHTWHEACPNNKPRCVIKEVNGANPPLPPPYPPHTLTHARTHARAGFTRIGERQRWNERGLVSRYHILPIQDINKAFDLMHHGESIRTVVTF